MVAIERRYVEQMIAQAKEEAPYEACGIIAGQEGRPVKLYRTANAEQSTTTYRLEPEEQYRIFLEMEEKGWELWAIYHSHPAFPPYPSARDIEQAYFPESLYLFVRDKLGRYSEKCRGGACPLPLFGRPLGPPLHTDAVYCGPGFL